jgi:hypothetical protein
MNHQLLLRQTLRLHRNPRPSFNRLPPTNTLRPMSKQLVHHSRRAQRAALALNQFRLCSRRDGDRAAERRRSRDDAGAGWRSGAGGYGGCCVWESGGLGAADLL